MESFEAIGAAKRRRLTCRAMPADGVKVKEERSVEGEVGPQRPEKGETNMETDDLWLRLKRKTEDMESHIRHLAGCDIQVGVTAEQPSFDKKEVADSVKVTNETGAEQEIMLSSADGSHATQGVEVFQSVGVPNEEAPRDEKTKKVPVAIAAEHPLLLECGAEGQLQVRRLQAGKAKWGAEHRVELHKLGMEGPLSQS